MTLYHLSEKDLDGKTLEPRVPENFMTRKDYEDNETPRVSLAESINGALKGIGGDLTNKKLFIHELDNKIKLKKDIQDQVPDAHLTKEVWGLEPAKLKRTGKIKVTDWDAKKILYEEGEMWMDNYNYKQAALNPDVEFKPYQQRAIDKILDQNALTVAHGTGTGKTVTGVGAMERLKEEGKGNKALVVTPASLRSNFGEHGVEKFTDSKHQIVRSGKDEIDPDSDYLITSHSLFSKDPKKFTKDRDTLIVDEAHSARNQSTALANALQEAAPNFDNRVMLTASPFNNSPGDLATLLNATKGKQEYGQSEIDNSYIKDKTKRFGPLSFIGIGKKKRVGEEFSPDRNLKKDLQKYFDYEEGKGNLPEVKEEVKKIPMTDEQLKAYRYSYNKLPKHVRMAVKRDIIPDKRDSSSFFGALMNARIASNNPSSLLEDYEDGDHSISAKALELQKDLEKTSSNMVYTNYNKHGAQVIANALKDAELKSSQIQGGMKDSDKDKQIEDFKSGKTDAFVTTPTGKEGISLPNVKQEVIFDPTWNPEVTRQAIGRGVRADSLADQVGVKQYIAVEPEKKKLFGIFKRKRPPSVEEWIHSTAEKKKKLQEQVYDYMGGG